MCHYIFLGVIIVFLSWGLSLLSKVWLIDNITFMQSFGCIVSLCSIFKIYSEYKFHLDKEKSNTLLRLNEAYKADSNMTDVVKDLIENKNETDTYKREMFLRFFEELQYSIDKKLIDKKEAHDLFSWYAEEAYKKNDFLSDLKHVWDDRECKDPWKTFKRFVKNK